MKLNIGAGNKKIDGFLSVDIRKNTNPDLIADFEQPDFLFDINSDEVHEILMSHVFEHIKNIDTFMKEIYRVCKNGASVTIISPYWSHRTAVEDPTHVRFLTENSMMFFDKDTISLDGFPIEIPYNFKTISVELIPEEEYGSLDALELKDKYLNVIKNVQFTLKVIK